MLLAAPVAGIELLREGFEAPFVNGAPPGWTREFKTGTTEWVRQAGYPYYPFASAHGGSFNAMLSAWYTTGGETWLITPVVRVPAGARLVFWHLQRENPFVYLSIFYKASAGEAWTELVSFTGDVQTWTQRTVSLPSPSTT